jgi:Domain of unknown function (DUF4440)
VRPRTAFHLSLIIVGRGQRVNGGESVEARDWARNWGRSRYNLGMNLRVMRLVVRKTGAEVARVRWMPILGLVAVLLLEAGCTMNKEHPANSFADATGGEGLERVFWKSVAAADWTDVDRALASNYSGVTASGTLDKAAAMEQYRQWQLKEYSLGDLKTELNGNTIVVTYAITLNGSAGGGAPLPSGPQHMMSVWQQQKKGWVEIAHTAGLP